MKTIQRSHSIRARRSIARLITASALTLLPGAGSSADAGLMQWSFSYHKSQVPVAIWHPGNEVARAIDAGPFTLQAASGGNIEAKPHPLVIISHGTGGSSVAHHPLAEALASAGYLVAALTHPGDNFQDRSLIDDDRYFAERPRQIHALLNALTGSENFDSLIDDSRIGAIGHSAGGFAVAAAIGANPDRTGLIEHCSAVKDDPSCSYRDSSIGVSSPSDKTFKLPPQLEEISATARIRSAVLLAPRGSVISAASRIDKNVPVQIIGAELDEILPHAYHFERLKTVAPHAKSRLAAGAGHFSFIAPVNDAWQSQLGEVAIDPPGFDRTEFNQQLGRELVEWFDATL